MTRVGRVKEIAPSDTRHANVEKPNHHLSPFPFSGNTAVSSDAVEFFICRLPAIS